MTVSYPSKVRNYLKTPPINSSLNDLVTTDGVRVSCPIYVDLTSSQRKELLNGARNACAIQQTAVSSRTASGISVTNSSNAEADVEAFIGMSLENLRNTLFQRGGLPIDVILKLQSVTGIEFVSQKDVAASMKAKAAVIKDFIQTYTYEG